MIGYMMDSYDKPIRTPVHQMRPADETCENCHWPEKHLGTKLVVRPHYRDNAEVSGFVNVILLRRGGVRALLGEATVFPEKIRYVLGQNGGDESSGWLWASIMGFLLGFWIGL